MNPSLSRRGALRAVATAAVSAAVCVSARPAPAAQKRVVSLELQLTEILVSLGAAPVAAADNPLYRRLIGQPELPANVLDLGPIQQPNLEFLEYLAPDLMVLPAWEASANRATLARVAPVEVIGDLERRPPLDNLDLISRRLAAIVGREGTRVALAAALDEACARANAVVSPQPTLLCRFFEDGRHLAVFSSNSVLGAVAARSGVANAWKGRQNAFGTALAAVETLASMPEARIVHFHRGAETDRALARLDRSPLWRALPPVARGEVIAMPVVHPNGGLASATRLADQLRAALGTHG